MTANKPGPRAKRGRRPPPTLVQVAVLAAIRPPLASPVPGALEVRVGQRLLVPPGPRRVIGCALELAPPLPSGIQVREVLRVLDAEPVLSP